MHNTIRHITGRQPRPLRARLSPLCARLASLLCALRTDRNGGVAAYVAASLVGLAGFMGLGLDVGRAYMVKSRLSSAVDSAALAGGHSYFEASRDGDVAKFFATNFPAGYMGATAHEPVISTDPASDSITVEASADVPTTFLQVLGVETVSVSSMATAQRAVRQMELALVMDNTGSMWGSPMTEMKKAAEELVNLVYGPSETHPNLLVSLVPFTATVNIGTQHTDWLAAGDRVSQTPSPYAPSTWKGCVTARPAPYDKTDDPPSVQPFTSFYYADDVDNDWYDPKKKKYNLDERLDARNDGRGPNLGCGPAIVPLVQSKTTIVNAIRNMGAWHRGGTTSNLGLIWGWRVLSPRWRGLWGGATPAERPLDYEDRTTQKVVVLFTDGNNQFYDWPGYYSGNTGNGPRGSDYTAYGRLNDFGFSSIDAANDELDDRMSEMCTAIKTAGIKIYTITFGGTPNAATQTLFRTCASEASWYFHAPNTDQLHTVFQQIGRQLSNLRLSR